MAEKTAIAWTDHTSNAWQGCTKVSPGCDGCYAEARDKRFHGGKHWGPGAPRLERLDAFAADIRKLNKKAQAEGIRRRVFVNSLSDFFDNEVPWQWRDRAWAVMRDSHGLDFQLLTKRIGNVLTMLPPEWALGPFHNVAIGCSVVNQEEANRDLPKLKAIKAWRRFVSYEPALGPIDWCEALNIWWNQTTGAFVREARSGIDWVIVGGESKQAGHVTRDFDLEWARATIRQCRAAGVKVFVKQVGSYPSEFTPPITLRFPVFQHRAGADPSEWPEDLRVQEEMPR